MLSRLSVTKPVEPSLTRSFLDRPCWMRSRSVLTFIRGYVTTHLVVVSDRRESRTPRISRCFAPVARAHPVHDGSGAVPPQHEAHGCRRWRLRGHPCSRWYAALIHSYSIAHNLLQNSQTTLSGPLCPPSKVRASRRTIRPSVALAWASSRRTVNTMQRWPRLPKRPARRLRLRSPLR